MGHHDESLLDKVKNALGMGGDDASDGTDEADAHATDKPTDGWAGVPTALHDDTGANAADEADGGSGLGRNPGPMGSARYEAGATGDADADLDARDDRVGTEFGGAYGQDDTPMPTSAAWDRGAPPPEETTPGSDEEELDRRGTGI